MSAETFAALEAALRAHVADVNPEFPLVTDWFAAASSVGDERRMTGYTYPCSDMPPHSATGLAGRALDQFDEDPLP